MTPEQYEEYRNASIKIHAQYVMGSIGADETTETTLLYGYTLERDSFHVYLKDGELHRLIYCGVTRQVKNYVKGIELPVDTFIPPKRAYPCRTMHSFALILEEYTYRGRISFTSFALSDGFLTSQNMYMAGKVIEDFD